MKHVKKTKKQKNNGRIMYKKNIMVIIAFIFSSTSFSQSANNSFNFGEDIPLEFEGFVQQDIGYAFSGTFFANKYTINLGDDVNLNWNFSGNSIPSSVNINGVYQDDLSVGSATAAPRNTTQYVITASNIHHTAVLDLDVRVEDWNLSNPSFSNWLNSDPGYNYTNWLPGNNVQTSDFTQNRNYSQNQGRISFEREFDNINEEYRFTGNRTVEDRIYSLSESRLVNVSKTTTFINIVPNSCNLWNPDANEIKLGTSFNQSRDCNANYNNEYVFSNGYSHNKRSISQISENRDVLGTKKLEKECRYGGFYIDRGNSYDPISIQRGGSFVRRIVRYGNFIWFWDNSRIPYEQGQRGNPRTYNGFEYSTGSYKGRDRYDWMYGPSVRWAYLDKYEICRKPI
jgi:hypothetical protein